MRKRRGTPGRRGSGEMKSWTRGTTECEFWFDCWNTECEFWFDCCHFAGTHQRVRRPQWKSGVLVEPEKGASACILINGFAATTAERASAGSLKRR
eukprot:3477741-Amphidinium_carterae.1